MKKLKTASSSAIITLENVSKTYVLGGRGKTGGAKVEALKDINLQINKGALIAIQGPSGSGKSTLLNIIGGIDTPTKGTVQIGGRDISKLSDRELTKVRLHKIGFIFQLFYLIPTLTAEENIELPMKEARLSREARKVRTRHLLKLVGLANRARHYPNQLSGGEQQRIAIARAMANEPEILLADEPTGEIDRPTSEKIMKILKDLNNKRKLTVILVTHDPNIAKRTNRTIVIEDGRIVR
jgi:putative ABC transport system ATP-binding protein